MVRQQINDQNGSCLRRQSDRNGLMMQRIQRQTGQNKNRGVRQDRRTYEGNSKNEVGRALKLDDILELKKTLEGLTKFLKKMECTSA